MKQISVLVDEEAVAITVFAKITERFFFGFGMKENGVVVIVKAKEDSSDSFTAVDVSHIRRLRRGEAKQYQSFPYDRFHGGTEVHNFFHKHDIPEEGEAHITALCAKLFRSYPTAELLFDIPKD